MAEITEYYEILGVNYGDSIKVIKSKFMELALIHHPDKGGDKTFFDLICKSYKKIREIRKFEDMPKEDVKYNTSEFDDNKSHFDPLENLRMTKKFLNSSGDIVYKQDGYQEFSRQMEDYLNGGNLNKIDPDDLIYKPVFEEDKNFRQPKIESLNRDFNNIDNINHSGRTTDSSGYYQLINYGDMTTKFGNKNSAEGYELGDAYNDTVIYDVSEDDFKEPVNNLLENYINERKIQDKKIQPGFDKNTIRKMDKYFDDENKKFEYQLNHERVKMKEKAERLMLHY